MQKWNKNRNENRIEARKIYTNNTLKFSNLDTIVTKNKDAKHTFTKYHQLLNLD